MTPQPVRVDAHHHFWQIGRYDYGWISPNSPVLYRNFGPEELEPLLARHGIDRSVLVQTISSVEETRWFLQIAGSHPLIAGVVGWIDLAAPSAGAVLDELQKSPRLLGIRHNLHDEPDRWWLARPEVERGLREVEKRSLAYDLLIRPAHLEPALEVARRFPGLRFVVDHIAKPGIAEQRWADWAPGLAALAQCGNVFCKLSGMITEASWSGWKAEDLRPYINHVLEVFGVDRVMFGSDWPVCLLAGSYAEVVEALEENLRHLAPAEREKVFGLNAIRFYGLGGKG